MVNSQSVFSITYDKPQDRLKLILKNQAAQETPDTEGMLSRRLLRGFLQGLPSWLDQQSKALAFQQQAMSVKVSDSTQHQTPALSSSGAPLSTKISEAPIAKRVSPFLVDSISLSATRQRDDEGLFELKFIAQDKNNNLAIRLNLQQFYAVISALVDNADTWDLVNPLQNTVIPSDWQTSPRVVH